MRSTRGLRRIGVDGYALILPAPFAFGPRPGHEGRSEIVCAGVDFGAAAAISQRVMRIG